MADIEAIFRQAAAKAPALALTSAAERVAKLKKLLKAVVDAKDAVAEVSHRELRTPYIGAIAQILMLKGEIDYTCTHLEDWMKPQDAEPAPGFMGRKAYVKYEPKGVFLNLATWNAPILISLHPAVGAIAAGNAVVIKPSELAPYSAALVQDIVASVFPRDEVAVVQGGPDVAQQLLAQPFNHIFYTGGMRVGRMVMKAAAENFASVTLEMGGKNPTIIDVSADLEDAAPKIALGRIMNAGQVCIAPDYALVPASRHDEFVRLFGRAANHMFNGDGKGFRHSETLPRIVNRQHFDRIRGLVEDAVGKGARVAFGGEMEADDLYISPTLLTGVTEDMKIMQEEIFGPVLPVIAYQSREEVLEIIHRRPKALASYVFATDRDAVDWFLDRTSSGSSAVNNCVTQAGHPTLPFGGANHSGLGRSGGHASFLEASNARSVVEDALDPSTAPAFNPSPEELRRMMEYMLTV
jgi:aldehyde dehydrogenase (NAD+)